MTTPMPWSMNSALADSRAGMNLDAGEKPARLRNDPREREPLALEQGMRKPVRPDGVQPGIGEYDLEHITGGGIVLKHRLDVGFHIAQTWSSPLSLPNQDDNLCPESEAK